MSALRQTVQIQICEVPLPAMGGGDRDRVRDALSPIVHHSVLEYSNDSVSAHAQPMVQLSSRTSLRRIAVEVIRGAGRARCGGNLMFEQHDKDDLESVMQSNSEFRQLYHKHKELDGKVRDAEIGALPMDAAMLHSLKREKLRAKDKLTLMWQSLRPHSAH
jgi:uncharacterized protein YdcH (DUF465 family)